MNAYEATPPASARLDRLEALVQRVDPHHDALSGRQLYRLAREESPTGLVVDLAADHGAWTLWLAAAMQDRGQGRVLAVDIWPAPAQHGAFGGWGAVTIGDPVFDAFRARVREAELDPVVETLRASAVTAGVAFRGREPIGLLHIGMNLPEPQWRDAFEAWARFVAPGGFLVIDGAGTAPVPSQLAMSLPRWWRWTGSCHSKWVFQRTCDPYPGRRDFGVVR